jgi:hypothetical protein
MESLSHNKILLECKIDESLENAVLFGDCATMNKIILNLLICAIKISSDPCSLNLLVSNSSHLTSQSELSYSEKRIDTVFNISCGGNPLLTVSNDNNVDHDVFAPFKNLKNHRANDRIDDNSLGLAICKELVLMLGGQIFYSYIEGRNVFEVCIPTILLKTKQPSNLDKKNIGISNKTEKSNPCLNISRFVENSSDSIGIECTLEISRIIHEMICSVEDKLSSKSVLENAIDKWNILIVDGIKINLYSMFE